MTVRMLYDCKTNVREDPVIIALDFESEGEAERLVDALGDAAGFYKVGMELYAAAAWIMYAA